MQESKYTILIPCFNEDSTILKVVSEIYDKNQLVDILLIDDGSTDNFKSIDFTPYAKRLKVITHHTNLGKGAAIKTGLKEINKKDPSSKVILFDADNEIESEAITRIINYFFENEGVQIIYGSRYLGNKLSKNLSSGLLRLVANKILTGIVNFKFNLRLTDMETAVKSFTINLINERDLISDGFEIEPEITIQLSRTGEDIHEIPIRYKARSKNEGKKISFKDGVKTLIYLIKNAN